MAAQCLVIVVNVNSKNKEALGRDDCTPPPVQKKAIIFSDFTEEEQKNKALQKRVVQVQKQLKPPASLAIMVGQPTRVPPP